MEEKLKINNNISEEVFEESFKDRILRHKVLSYFYDDDPKKTILNICSYSLQSDLRLDFAKQKATRLFNGMKFDNLYDNKSLDWSEYFNKTINKMKNKYVPPKNGERISKFIVIKDVNKIPKHLWVIPSKNQNIKEEEFIFILKVINFKILKNWNENGKDFYTLPQNWFLNQKAKENYYKTTKRKVNRHKISKITELLFEYKLIVKYQPWDKKTNKIKPIVYKFGDENFYKRRILMI